MEAVETQARFYGWRVTAAAHFGVMLGFALNACTFSVFVKPLAASFGWSRAAIAGGFALSALSVALVSPFAGNWIDRHNPRSPVLVSVIVFAAAFLSLSVLTAHIWHFYIVCLLIGCAGNTIQMGYTQAVSTCFTRKRGLALGLMLAGEGIGLMIFPLGAEKIVSFLGWRSAYVVLGSLILLLSLPSAILYARSRPLPPNPPSVEQSGKSALSRNLRAPSFWIVVAVLFLSSFGVNGALTQQVPLLTDRGLAASAAALTVSILGGCSLSGRVLTGWLLDRFPAPLLTFALVLLAAGGILLLARSTTFATGCAAALLLGFGAGGTSSATPYLLTRYFGAQGFSTLYGLTWTAYAVAGGTGPMLLGYMYDRTASYTSTLIILSLATLGGALLLLLLPEPPPVLLQRIAPGDLPEAIFAE